MKTKFIRRYDALDVVTYALISLIILLFGFVIGFQLGEMYTTKNQEDTPTIIYNEVDNVEIKLNIYVLSTSYSLLILLSLPNTYVNFKYSGNAVNVVISVPEYFKALNVTALGEITFAVFLVAEFALVNIS